MNLQKFAARKLAFIYEQIIRENAYRLHGHFHDTVTVKTKQGLLTMSTRDSGIARHLYRTKQYEFDSSIRTVRFLKKMKLIPQDNVQFLDIGANIGIISIGLLLANEIEEAVGIEPEPGNFKLLEKNALQNDLSKRLTCLQMAVGEKESALTMELSATNPGDHRVRTKPVGNQVERYNESSRQTIQVQSLPLEKILKLPQLSNSAKKNPSMLWVDVQGFEGYIFAGAKEFLGKGIPTVSEIWPYGIQRAGMSTDGFCEIVSDIWSDYWIERRNRFVRYPITVFDRFLDELGDLGAHENVIFT